MFSHFVVLSKITSFVKTRTDDIFRVNGIDFSTFQQGMPQMVVENKILVKRIFDCIKEELHCGGKVPSRSEKRPEMYRVSELGGLLGCTEEDTN